MSDALEAVEPGFWRLAPREGGVERIPTGCSFCEGPVWMARDGCLLFSDAPQDRILRWRPGVGLSTFLEPSGHALGLTCDRQGRLVAAGWSSRNVWRLEPDGRISVLATQYQGRRINTPNDIVVRSDGSIYWTDGTGALDNPSFWAGDVQRYLDYAAVFRLAPDGSTVAPLADDFEAPNGIAFSIDEGLLYVDDTRRRHVRVFDVRADGTLANGRLFYVDRGDESGNPDGMKLDIDGNLYVTGSGGIHVISPEGALLGRIRVPAFNVAWGDDDWTTLYATGRTEVYRIRWGIAGVPV